MHSSLISLPFLATFGGVACAPTATSTSDGFVGTDSSVATDSSTTTSTSEDGSSDSADGAPTGWPQIIVEVDEQVVTSGYVVALPTALQLPVAREIVLTNGGTAPLRVARIAWDTDGQGQPRKNAYVSLSTSGVTFPRDLLVGGADALTFSVTYTPPQGALDDFSPSVLVIGSDARDTSGEPVPELRLTFELATSSVASVSPMSYTFRNATPEQAESQDFIIYNDAEVSVAAFNILSVSLESPSSEFVLLGAPAAGTLVRAPGDPSYQHVTFAVRYLPTDDGADQNAILIETDADLGSSLRVPLTSSSSIGTYSLSYSHVDELDFGGTSQPSTRSVVLTSEGPGSLIVKAPRIEPSQAAAAFSFTARVLPIQVGDPETEITSWPRALSAGRAIRFEVTHTPGGGSDGRLVVPIDSPDPEQIIIELGAGDP